MPKNICGFVPKRYRQPLYYKELFRMWNAVYRSKSGKVYYLQARPHFLNAEWDGANIENYELLRQDPDCRRSVCMPCKTIKAAFDVLEKLLEK